MILCLISPILSLFRPYSSKNLSIIRSISLFLFWILLISSSALLASSCKPFFWANWPFKSPTRPLISNIALLLDVFSDIKLLTSVSISSFLAWSWLILASRSATSRFNEVLSFSLTSRSSIVYSALLNLTLSKLSSIRVSAAFSRSFAIFLNWSCVPAVVRSPSISRRFFKSSPVMLS